MDTNPLILLVAYIEETGSSEDVTDFFSVMNVLFEEGFDFVLVGGEFVGVDCDDVGVGVPTIICGGSGGGFSIVYLAKSDSHQMNK